MSFTQNMGLMLRSMKRYGFWAGWRFYRQVRTHRENVLNLPTLKYPIYLRPHTSDITAFFQVFWHEQYKINTVGIPKTIIDAGGNVGLASVYLSNKYPDAKIYCIEPDSDNYAILCKNTAPYKNVTPLHNGIWHENAYLGISDKFNMGKWAMIVEPVDTTGMSEGEKSKYVNAISIDEIVSRYGLESIDLLKVDIEGSEKELFMKNYERWLPITRQIIIEVHDHFKPGSGYTLFEALHHIFEDYHITVWGESLVITPLKLKSAQ